jgi:hypothetical protein
VTCLKYELRNSEFRYRPPIPPDAEIIAVKDNSSVQGPRVIPPANALIPLKVARHVIHLSRVPSLVVGFAE